MHPRRTVPRPPSRPDPRPAAAPESPRRRLRGPGATLGLLVAAAAVSASTSRVPEVELLIDPLPDIEPGPWTVRLTDLASTLVFPTDVAAPPDGSGRLFVTEVAGRVRVIDGGALLAAPVLDFTAQGFQSNGSAMSGLAFHPQFAVDRRFYVVMTENAEPALADFGSPVDVAQQSVLYEVALAADHPAAGSNQIDPGATRELLRINESSTIHNLNGLCFGPDGYLYLGKGDDLTGGQDLSTVHGSILRIDVDRAPGNPLAANGQYAIPADNPHLGAGGIEEIWAHGFRNPWRLAFDDDVLWVADVGEFSVEEVVRVVPGGNHGWPHKEGSFAKFPGGVSDDLSGLPSIDFVDPVGQYDHGQLDLSISGGVLYRGTLLPGLVGRYLFADWISGRLLALDTSSGAIEALSLDPGGAGIRGQLLGPPYEGVIGVAADADGELLVVVTERGSAPTGRVVRVGAPAWQDLGLGQAGAAGTPFLEGVGSLAAGELGALELWGAAPSAPSALFVSSAAASGPLAGVPLVPALQAPPLIVATDATGGASVPFGLPLGLAPAKTLYVQWAVIDPTAPAGVALSNALLGVTQ